MCLKKNNYTNIIEFNMKMRISLYFHLIVLYNSKINNSQIIPLKNPPLKGSYYYH